jgi:hypothetical protein
MPPEMAAVGVEELYKGRVNEADLLSLRGITAQSRLARCLLWMMSFILKRAIARHLRDMKGLP